jgi:hypothetical protein
VVAGGLDKKDANALARPPEDILAFARALGAEIIAQGHQLLTGCRTELDAAVAEGASQTLAAQGTAGPDVRRRIVSYVNQGTAPTHDIGAILQSELIDWELGGRELNAPEIIRYADAVILVGGFRGTFRAANWARIERKPLLPVALFGGAAKDVCLEEAKRVETFYAGSITKQDYEAVLKSLSIDWNALAAGTVNLAERMATSRDVFVIMSFQKAPEYRDLRSAIAETCKKAGYEARRVDEANDQRRIIPEIIRGVRQSAFVIADVTESKPNVYWELGLATGFGKDVVVVAKKGTNLPFDINDVPVLFWESFEEFKEELGKRVEKIAAGQGRA